MTSAHPANSHALPPSVIVFSDEPGPRKEGLVALYAMGRLTGVNRAPGWMVLAYARLGMADSVFSQLCKAIEQRDDVLAHTITSPLLAPYQKDPRWDAIVGATRRR